MNNLIEVIDKTSSNKEKREILETFCKEIVKKCEIIEKKKFVICDKELLDDLIENKGDKYQWHNEPKECYEFIEKIVKPRWNPMLNQLIIYQHFELVINEDMPIRYLVEYHQMPSLISPTGNEKIKKSWEIIGIDQNFKLRCLIKYIKAFIENDKTNMICNEAKIFHGHVKYHEFERVAYGRTIYKKNGEVFDITQDD